MDIKIQKNVFIHETAQIDQGVSIGSGTKIWHICHLERGSKVGCGCTLGRNVYLGKGVQIGDNVKIQNNVSIFTGVNIEDNVFIAPSVTFTNVKIPIPGIPTNKYMKTIVETGAVIGANATILCGLIIGKNSFIGAGSVVTKEVPGNAIVVGNPAKIIGWRKS